MGRDAETAARSGVRSAGLAAWIRLARVFHKVDQLSTEHLRVWGISLAQFDVLAQVGAAEGCSQGDLARALLVTKGNICQLLDRMERDGLLRRQQDGRTNRLFLTGRGRALHDAAVPAQEALIVRLFSVLAPGEETQLVAALRVLDHSLQGTARPGERPCPQPPPA